MHRGRLALLAVCAACVVTPPPGDVVMGVYALHAQPVDLNCGVAEVADGGFVPFDFDVTLTQQSDASTAYLTTSGCEPSNSNCVRDASWDGQVLTSTASAARVFGSCGSCSTQLVETIALSMFSRSQAEAVGLGCPPEALDGGTPSPNDAGITRPGITSAGFDSILACGELRTTLVATNQDGGSCAAECLSCTTRFVLTGARK